MELIKFKDKIPSVVYGNLERLGISILRPSQVKSIKKGLFLGKNLLVCTPTASGKTLVGEMAILNCSKKSVYVVPLKALANEKYNQFVKRYPQFKIALTSGDMDGDDSYLARYDVIITTSEKLDSLIRHNSPWIKDIGVFVVDEIHLLNDTSRGPTLEILITLMRHMLPELQIIGLSATIGNSKELASWLDAELVEDSWRPVRLDKGVIVNDVIHFP